MMDGKRGLGTFLTILFIAGSTQAVTTVNFTTIPCKLLSAVYQAIWSAGVTLVVLMTLYAALLYVYSSGDPGGRKKAKNMIINAIIGGILMAAWAGIRSLLEKPTLTGTILNWGGCGF